MKTIYIIFFLVVLLFVACEGLIIINEFNDETPPVILYSTPTNATANIQVNPDIFIYFDDPVLSSSVDSSSVYLVHEGTGLVVPTEAPVVINDGKTVALKLFSNLEDNTNYRVYVTTGIKNFVQSNLPSEYLINFTTGVWTNDPNPYLNIFYPTNNQTVYGTFEVRGSVIPQKANCTNFQFKVNNGGWIDTDYHDFSDWRINLSPSQEGMNTNYFRVTDSLGYSRVVVIPVNLVKVSPTDQIISNVRVQGGSGWGITYSHTPLWYVCNPAGEINSQLSTGYWTSLYHTQDHTFAFSLNQISTGQYFRIKSAEYGGEEQLTFTFQNTAGEVIDQVIVKISDPRYIVGSGGEFTLFHYNGVDVTAVQTPTPPSE